MKYASVSVIIPCYNSMLTINRAVESVFAQSIRPKEVILINDCSTDETLLILQKIKFNYNKAWVKILDLKENSGAATARNRGWDVASQKYIAFLDSDDVWHPQKIEIQYSWMINNPTAVLSGHKFTIACKNQVHKNYKDSSGFYRVGKFRLLLSNKFSTPTVILKRDIAQRFPYGKRYSEDYQLWLDIIFSGMECYRIDLPLVYLFKSAYGESGLSSNMREMQRGEVEGYKHLLNEKQISITVFYTTILLSNLKYIKRILKIKASLLTRHSQMKEL